MDELQTSITAHRKCGTGIFAGWRRGGERSVPKNREWKRADWTVRTGAGCTGGETIERRSECVIVRVVHVLSAVVVFTLNRSFYPTTLLL